MVIGLDYVYQPSEKPKIVEGPRVDSDGDGILDSEDNCPEELEDFDSYEDEDGCPEEDNDGDGILDKKDNCPNEPENQNGITDEDGCPEFDSDGDGITDGLDTCPDEAEDLDGWADGDGCPEDDADFDEINDTEDSCPDLPESINRYKDADGCPDYMKVENGEIVLLRAIRFVKNGTELKRSSFPVVEELADIIIARPEWTEIEFIVHTSGKGDDASMQDLSERRAMALMRHLIHSGIVPERLIATGKGNSEPVAPPSTLEGRMNNERVQIFVRKGASK
jgi:outer membrane protein OmpA-like peptidoglycan-associated protein